VSGFLSASCQAALGQVLYPLQTATAGAYTAARQFTGSQEAFARPVEEVAGLWRTKAAVSSLDRRKLVDGLFV
jgi:hypothetical protein